MIGKTIGAYTITDTIGVGGMGEVFVGEDMMLQRQVAIKLLRSELASRPDVVARFRTEAVTLAQLNHSNIATVYAFVQEGTDIGLVMEYVRGWTLQRLLELRGALTPESAVGLFQQALNGIGFAHQHHIIHRDLKPSNMMLTETGVIKVMDFGLARVLGSAHLTRTGRLVGTLEYISPEQLRGEETDIRSDIYSLGILLYELVTGRVPFENTSEYALIRAQVETPPPSPRSFTSAVSPELEHVILRALAKAPDERFQSTETFSHALANCVAETDTRDIVSALLTPPQAHTGSASPSEAPTQETRLVSQPETEPDGIKATRLVEGSDSGVAETRAPRSALAWKAYWAPAAVLVTSIAAVGLLFFLGMPSPIVPRGSDLPLKTPVSVVEPLPQDAPPSEAVTTPAESSQAHILPPLPSSSEGELPAESNTPPVVADQSGQAKSPPADDNMPVTETLSPDDVLVGATVTPPGQDKRPIPIEFPLEKEGTSEPIPHPPNDESIAKLPPSEQAGVPVVVTPAPKASKTKSQSLSQPRKPRKRPRRKRAAAGPRATKPTPSGGSVWRIHK